MKKILYYDCFAGISGDMNLGALIDLGVDQTFLIQELTKLNISGFHLEISRDKRKGIAGTKAKVIIENQDKEHHRNLAKVEEIINKSGLSETVKANSKKIFNVVAKAEAKVHDIDLQQVHFHEVGALDSIADIVGAAICIEYLNVDEIISLPIQLGSGLVMCAHGKMPVPAPATAEIVRNIPVKIGFPNHEATTPTGAAIVVAMADRFATSIEFNITKTGYGIGQRDTDIPNVLRVFLAEIEEPSTNEIIVEDAYMLECNIDDMNPEWFEHVSNLLHEAGASEVFLSPVIMKKLRPANMLCVLAKPGFVGKLKEIIFTHTTTIGLREYKAKKNLLHREEKIVETKFGKVSVKISYLNGKIINSKPEYEDLKRLALANNASIQDIQIETLKRLEFYGS